jgi:6-phosphogluconate dehydrogenase
MQLIAESWDVMRRVLGIPTLDTADVFAKWNEGPLASFLLELSARVCRVIDPVTQDPLVDHVLDKAGQKGTGRWTSQVALDLGVSHPTIAAAIDARVLSSMRDERVAASAALSGDVRQRTDADMAAALSDLHDGLYASRICAYAQGMALIAAGSSKYQWNVTLSEVARIWKGGCIIRARLLDPIREAYARLPALVNILQDPAIGRMVTAADAGWRRVIQLGVDGGVPLPAHSSALAYFDGYRSARLPQSLTQAQRDAFGAHKYQRIDGEEQIHSEW